MADIELGEQSVGYEYDIAVYDPENTDSFNTPQLANFAALGITNIYLTIWTQDFATILLNRKPMIVIPNGSIARWAVSSGDIPAAGNYWGMLSCEDAGGNIVIPTYPYMTVLITKRP